MLLFMLRAKYETSTVPDGKSCETPRLDNWQHKEISMKTWNVANGPAWSMQYWL